MSMTDPVADLLTRVRNACLAGHRRVDIPVSKLKTEIARLLRDHDVGGVLGGHSRWRRRRRSLDPLLQCVELALQGVDLQLILLQSRAHLLQQRV